MSLQALTLISIIHLIIISKTTTATCTTPNGELGNCIAIKQCQPILDLLMNATTMEERMKLKEYQCDSNSPQLIKVCCAMIIEKNELTTHRNYQLLDHLNCGVYHDKGLIRTMQAELGEYPYIALLAYKKQTNSNSNKEEMRFECVATLINQRYVLTSAVCLMQKQLIGVRVGEFDLIERKDCDGDGATKRCADTPQDLLIEKVIIHPEFNANDLRNNIGLIRLAQPANTSTDGVKPICLPFHKTNNQKFRTIGWNLLNENFSQKLRLTQMHPITIEECKRQYEKKHLTFDENRLLCAHKNYDGHVDVLDNGAPLMDIEIPNDLRMVQYGVLATNKQMPGDALIYTKVDEYMKWILDTIEN